MDDHRNACVSCGGTDLTDLRAYRTDTRAGRRLFRNMRVVECARCRLVQCHPMPTADSLASYYAEDYRQSGLGGNDMANLKEFPRDNLFYLNRGRSVAELLQRHLGPTDPRVVDIGAGFGHVLHAIGEAFPRSSRVAIELSEPCLAHLRSLDIEVHSRLAEEVLPDLGSQFDVVTISHVLEHLLNPNEVLGHISTALAPGGLLYIEVPNIPADCVLRYPDNKWAPRYDEPHSVFFSRDTLERMVNSVGLETVFLDTAGPEYELISALRYRLPPLRPTIERFIPRKIFFALRSMSVFSRVKVQERETSFTTYGGFRIWLRGLFRRPLMAADA